MCTVSRACCIGSVSRPAVGFWSGYGPIIGCNLEEFNVLRVLMFGTGMGTGGGRASMWKDDAVVDCFRRSLRSA